MEQSTTIEFSVLPDDTAPHLRHFYRVPVHNEKHAVSIFISEIGYKVSDISHTGIGLLVEDSQTFEVGERLEACRLQFDEIDLTGLTGKIVHCSPHEGFWKFGIQWMDMTDVSKQEMDTLLARLKEKVMVSSQSVLEDTGREK
jgi:c-di-GMP-binding flagellar brake protein YcgR